ncbi:isoaspartyl peptidase/L-asparaginase [Metallosphaera hakonensis]|uniref:Plant-type L-asparaginase n=1 Tax=Metallosphaera hakonensis JCM 8857 = DSM 7519 TaxID=1293036 RepID=A0A2U9IS45_9CREN|nr:isoaspartyl peptidase/L-asparaginase [Metallosphaera hakonensis]AWR98859.1 arginase [Metallosphaera hakonensis JCM 8857 = DSM 7519]
MKYTPPMLLIHGGAGSWRSTDKEKAVKVLRESLERGYLEFRRGSSLEAVVEAVATMEDSGIFNAGRGSVRNSEEGVEMDAGVMYGSTLSVGSVASIRTRNPIKKAYEVLKQGKHVLMVRTIWEEVLTSGSAPSGDTVGAVALDEQGNLSAGTSTGGIKGKLPGRVGDSPIPGAGFYATSRIAVSSTGIGELILKFLPAKEIDILRAMGYPLEDSVRAVISKFTETFGKDNLGLIALDHLGFASALFNTSAMPRGIRWSNGIKVLFDEDDPI